MTHTPGPWTAISRHGPIAGGGFNIAALDSHACIAFLATLENARLIAAAPCLLQALTALLSDVTQYGLYRDGTSDIWPESAQVAHKAITRAIKE